MDQALNFLLVPTEYPLRRSVSTARRSRRANLDYPDPGDILSRRFY